MALLLKADADGVKADDSETYQGFVKSRGIPPTDDTQLAGVAQAQQPILLARAESGVTLSLVIDRDFGLEVSPAASLLLTPGGTEIGVTKKFEGAALADILVVQAQLGDAAAAENTWSLDQLHFAVTADGDT